MRIFDLKEVVLNLPHEGVSDVVDAIKAEQAKTAAIADLPNINRLKDIARRKGSVSSCALGNVFISDRQEHDLFHHGTAVNFQTHIVKGYAEALRLIDEVYEQETLSVSFILQLHYTMYKDYNPDFGGKLKTEQNYIQELRKDGTYRKIFNPASPEEALPLLDSLCYQFNEVVKDPEVDPLPLIAAFCCDFRLISPFAHGNGRVSRLLMHFLFKKYGYPVDDYLALPYLLEKRVADYLEALKQSAEGWGSATNSYVPYITFLLSVVLEAYRRLHYTMKINTLEGDDKAKVLRIVRDAATPINEPVVSHVMYGLEPNEVDALLDALVEEGKIERIERGFMTRYAAR